MRARFRRFRVGARAARPLPLYRLAVFPVLTLLALGLTWAAVAVKVHDARQDAVQEGLRHAGDVAHTFEQYSGRAVRQIDQVTRFVAFEFLDHGEQTPLQDLTSNVLVSPAVPALLSLADPQGLVYATSMGDGDRVSIADRAHFQVPRDHPEVGLFVSRPVTGRVSHLVTIQASRRLTFQDGSFGGVVVVSMPPTVFSSFYTRAEMGEHGFVGLAGLDGVYRATRTGRVEGSGEAVLNARMLSEPSGTTFFDAHQTHDGQARFVGWRRLDGYPLVAVVGLAEDDEMADFQALRDSWFRMAEIGSVALFALGLLATGVHRRLELRRLAGAQAKAAYRTASEGTQDGFFILQAVYDDQDLVQDFTITDVNDRGAQMFEVAPEALTGTRLSQWFGGTMGERLQQRYALTVTTGRPFEQAEVRVDCENPLKDRWVSHRAVPAPLGLAITVRDITQLKQQEHDLRWLADHDPVTNLRNRTWLQSQLPALLERAGERHEQLALFFIDLDDFKKVNDTLGHAAGDRLLREVGDRLATMSREEDLVCRLGGDEFTLVVQGTLGHTALHQLGQRVLLALGQPMLLDGQTVTVGASVGVSVFPDHGQDAATLLQRADLAMYQAKDQGKGGCEFFQPALAATADARLLMERDLRDALLHDELFLVFQPKVGLSDLRLRGMEALLRWQSPSRGMVSPLEFIGLAERNGLILPIGERVIEKACAQIAAWRAQGLEVPPVSVNVSPRQLHRVDLAGQLSDALARHHLPPSAIEVEITESSMMEDPELSQQRLHAVKALGVRILVDDFGTGYSSLALLKRFEVDVLKVDRSFVKDVPDDAEDCAILQAVVSMAQALNMGVVAEGVETQEQCAFLQRLGCNEGQGYLFSRPLPAVDMVTWLRAPDALPSPGANALA